MMDNKEALQILGCKTDSKDDVQEKYNILKTTLKGEYDNTPSDFLETRERIEKQLDELDIAYNVLINNTETLKEPDKPERDGPGVGTGESEKPPEHPKKNILKKIGFLLVLIIGLFLLLHFFTPYRLMNKNIIIALTNTDTNTVIIKYNKSSLKKENDSVYHLNTSFYSTNKINIDLKHKNAFFDKEYDIPLEKKVGNFFTREKPIYIKLDSVINDGIIKQELNICLLGSNEEKLMRLDSFCKLVKTDNENLKKKVKELDHYYSLIKKDDSILNKKLIKELLPKLGLTKTGQKVTMLEYKSAIKKYPFLKYMLNSNN